MTVNKRRVLMGLSDLEIEKKKRKKKKNRATFLSREKNMQVDNTEKRRSSVHYETFFFLATNLHFNESHSSSFL